MPVLLYPPQPTKLRGRGAGVGAGVSNVLRVRLPRRLLVGAKKPRSGWERKVRAVRVMLHHAPDPGWAHVSRTHESLG